MQRRVWYVCVCVCEKESESAMEKEGLVDDGIGSAAVQEGSLKYQ